ncbi:MAG: alpha/beta fold hydrolase [Myxococcales bacterium]|nr:alpha/beta fold hydrolase [Myxococcales bacterium]
MAHASTTLSTPRQAPSEQAGASLFVRAADGVRLHVKYVPSTGGPSGSPAGRGAVVLCHGLASNGFAFDVPQRSLARFLAGRGYECFIPDLRGTGKSMVPSSGEWGLDDYLDLDLPAILQFVGERTESGPLYWIGHSMGGILFMLYASDHPGVPVRRATAIASSLDYRPGLSVYRFMAPVRPLWPRRLHVPFGLLSRVSAVAGSRGLPLPPELINFQRSNLELELRSAILNHGFGTIPKRLLDDLATSLSPGGLARRRGTHQYQSRLPAARVPLQLIAGAGDLQCSVEAVDQTARMLDHLDELRVHVFGKAYGHADDYGHFDLMVGRHAEHEVWPELVRWLNDDGS